MKAEADIAALQSLARATLTEWDLRGEPELIAQRENAVFRVFLADGSPAALRIHRRGYHSDAALNAELQWMAMLREGGVQVPAPMPTRDGRLLVSASCPEVAGQRQVDLLQWLDGKPLGRSGEPLVLQGGARLDAFHRLGATAAQLHDLSDRWPLPPNFTRHAWDADGLLGEQPFWGRFWELEILDATQRELIDRVRKVAAEALAEYAANGGDYGLIHADLVRENVLLSGDAVQILDFDDAGFGWRLFEIATALHKNRDEPDYPALEAALLDGYRSRRPLRAADIDALPLFTLLRSFTYMGWARGRGPAGGTHPRAPLFAARACVLATDWLVKN